MIWELVAVKAVGADGRNVGPTKLSLEHNAVIFRVAVFWTALGRWQPIGRELASS